MPPPRQGLRGFDRKRRGLDPRRQYQAADPKARPLTCHPHFRVRLLEPVNGRQHKLLQYQAMERRFAVIPVADIVGYSRLIEAGKAGMRPASRSESSRAAVGQGSQYILKLINGCRFAE